LSHAATAMWDCSQLEYLLPASRKECPPLSPAIIAADHRTCYADQVTEHLIAQVETGRPERPGGRIMSLLVRPTPPPFWLGLVAAAALIGPRDSCHRFCSKQWLRPGLSARCTCSGYCWSEWPGVRISVRSPPGERRRVRHLPSWPGQLRLTSCRTGGDCRLFVVRCWPTVFAGWPEQARSKPNGADTKPISPHGSRRRCAGSRRWWHARSSIGGVLDRGPRISQLSGCSHAALFRYEPDGTALCLRRPTNQIAEDACGRTLSLDGENVGQWCGTVAGAARMDSHDHAAGTAAARIRALVCARCRSADRVDSLVWGAAIAGSHDPMPFHPARSNASATSRSHRDRIANVQATCGADHLAGTDRRGRR